MDQSAHAPAQTAHDTIFDTKFGQTGGPRWQERLLGLMFIAVVAVGVG